nr:ATP-binding protein [Pseudomaricurvus alcaniphilus]
MRRIARPLRDLAQAASDLGRGRSVAPLPLRGPQDVQDTVAAFNTMNERLDRFVSERTRMLAALSHDLRTPMTSMRLRLELMPPSEERDKLIASLEEMQQMAEATLSFVRQAGDQEALQKVDLNALLGSLCDDLAALEQPVNYADTGAQTLMCRPVSLKRALRNLIENAVRYGGAADVSLKRQGNSLVVAVRDSGPGIPEAEMEAVFDPFYRLESSRNRETGGMGLGLSIARQIIHSHGGQLTLTNTHPGLKVSVSLPVQ